MQLSSVFLFITTLLTGFLGGIGFLNFMSFGPTLRKTPAEHLILYWQSLDGYMSVRMPIFGSILLAFFIVTGIFLLRQSFKLPFVFLCLSLAIVLIDFWIGTIYNFPVNKVLQTITVDNIPGNFEDLRSKAVFGFAMRSICMIGSFMMMLTSIFFQATKGLIR
jgi:hypothetical protein